MVHATVTRERERKRGVPWCPCSVSHVTQASRADGRGCWQAHPIPSPACHGMTVWWWWWWSPLECSAGTGDGGWWTEDWVSEGPACSPLMDEWMLSRAVKATCHPLGKKKERNPNHLEMDARKSISSSAPDHAIISSLSNSTRIVCVR